VCVCVCVWMDGCFAHACCNAGVRVRVGAYTIQYGMCMYLCV
jgi:hypothetical protein